MCFMSAHSDNYMCILKLQWHTHTSMCMYVWYACVWEWHTYICVYVCVVCMCVSACHSTFWPLHVHTVTTLIHTYIYVCVCVYCVKAHSDDCMHSFRGGRGSDESMKGMLRQLSEKVNHIADKTSQMDHALEKVRSVMNWRHWEGHSRAFFFM
jgi:hypothetical protein